MIGKTMQAHFLEFWEKHKFTSKIITNLKIGIANNFLFSSILFYVYMYIPIKCKVNCPLLIVDSNSYVLNFYLMMCSSG